MDEETQPVTKHVIAPHRMDAFNEVSNNIRNLHEDISSALDLSVIKTHFVQHVDMLKQKEDKLRDTVKKLELTKETLIEEVHFRESEENRISEIIDDLRTQKNNIKVKLSGYECDVKNIQTEKEKLDALVARMKSVLSEMREKIREFSTIVKAE